MGKFKTYMWVKDKMVICRVKYLRHNMIWHDMIRLHNLVIDHAFCGLPVQTVFLISSICTFASAILVVIFVPETRGKTLVEIEEYYKQFVKSSTSSSSINNLSQNTDGPREA